MAAARQDAKTKFVLVVISIVLLAVAALELGVAMPWIRQAASGGGADYPRFLVLGDWGRHNEGNQSVVAAAMARKAASLRPHFVVSTGDNFYESGLVSAADPAFDASFVRVYAHKELQVPWHVALGNHDYGETTSASGKARCSEEVERAGECFYSPAHQLDARLAARDPRWHCERAFSVALAGGAVELFFIDTTPVMTNYLDASWAGNRGGVLEQSWEDGVRELEGRLARSAATWKLVVGHHPIRTNHRPDFMFPDMVARVEPVLRRHGVQAYFCGHDHNLQHLHSPAWGYNQVTSGAGSEVSDRFYGRQDSPFQYGANGFAAVTVSPESMLVEYMGVDSDQPLFAIQVPLRMER